MSIQNIVPVLRDYLYVDIDRVRGLSSQITDSIPEKKIDNSSRDSSAGIKLKIAELGSSRTKGSTTEYSLEDTLFKALESDLESLGFLEDVSLSLASEKSWDEIRKLIYPGKIIRLTSQGSIFHPSQVNDFIVSIATTSLGLVDLGSLDPLSGQGKSVHKNQAQKKLDQESKNSAKNPSQPEDYLPKSEFHPDVDRQMLSGIMRVIRGTFADGLHLYQRPLGKRGPAVIARLEEGRRFLDSSPSVLLSRYGVSEQEWTIVGIVGQMGISATSKVDPQVVRPDSSINRAGVIDLVENLIRNTAGFMDVPRDRDFTVIPIAVYRSIVPFSDNKNRD